MEEELNEKEIQEQVEYTSEKPTVKKFDLEALDEEKEMPPAQELTVNPYYEEDPKVEGEEYEPSKFLSRGCSSCPQSYHVVDQKEIHRCAKLDDHNWMRSIKKPFNENNFDIVEVRFKNSRKDFFRIPEGLDITEGDVVAVEGSPGHDVGIVSMTGELCRIQMKKRSVKVDTVRRLYRRAKVSDIEKWIESLEQEESLLRMTKDNIQKFGLAMKLNDVELQGDGSKAVFYYTADDRVDFRDLIKLLADQLKVRVEMRQIGVRQESSRLGGIGTCGRELCCATWLTNFQSVNTATAKVQQIALNPQKLAGQCGKLKCCLNFEYETYLEAISEFPASNIPLKTKKGTAHYVKADIFRKLIWYSYERDNAMYALSVDSVKEIISANERDELPEKIEDFKTELMEKTIEVEPSDMQFDINILAENKAARDERARENRNRQKSNNRQNNRQQQGNRSQNDRQSNSQNQKERPVGEQNRENRKPQEQRQQGQKPQESQSSQNKTPQNEQNNEKRVEQNNNHNRGNNHRRSRNRNRNN